MLGLSNKTLGIASGIIGTTAIGGGTAVYLTYGNNKDIKTTSNTKSRQDNSVRSSDTQTIPLASSPAPKTDTNKSITEYLKGKNLQLIGEGEDDNWSTKWKNFQTAYKNSNPPAGWELGGWDSKKNSPTIPSEFKELCKNKGNKKISDENDADFEPTKTYCTKAIAGAAG